MGRTQNLLTSKSPLQRRLTRRHLIGAGIAGGAGLTALGAYAGGIEPRLRLEVRRYALQPASWPRGCALRIVVIADVHAGVPYMPLSRIEEIVAVASAQNPDIVVLLGDYIANPWLRYEDVAPSDWARVLTSIPAPLGTHAILGNADWWDDGVMCREALNAAGLPVLENDARLIDAPQGRFWIAGLADQLAYHEVSPGKWIPQADLPRTLKAVTSEDPVILLVHEPQIFAQVPSRVALTLAGHTHGGQVRIAGWSPISAHSMGNRYAYGHVREGDRHLIVSGGLGVSKVPVRLGVPPEIVVVDLS